MHLPATLLGSRGNLEWLENDVPQKPLRPYDDNKVLSKVLSWLQSKPGRLGVWVRGGG